MLNGIIQPMAVWQDEIYTFDYMSGVYTLDVPTAKWVHKSFERIYIGAIAALSDGLYLIGGDYGVYFSPDGEHWEIISGGLIAPGPEAMFITDAGTLLSSARDGLFRSADDGASWDYICIGYLDDMNAFAERDGTIYGSASRNLYRSTDDGASWEYVTYLGNAGISSLAFIGGELYCGSYGGFYKLADDKLQHVQVDSTSEQEAKKRYTYIRATSDDCAYLSYGGTKYATYDGGATWAEHSDIIPALETDEAAFILTSHGIAKKLHGTDEWISYSSGVPKGYRLSSLTAVGDAIYATASPCGVLKSVDGGATWGTVMDGLRPAGYGELLYSSSCGKLFFVGGEGLFSLTPSMAAPSDKAIPVVFADISATSWYYDSAVFAFESGIVRSSYIADTPMFRPDDRVTRGGMAMMLTKYAGAVDVDLAEMPFGDVESGTRWAHQISWAWEQGYMTGYNKVTFAPNDFLTREQFIVIMHRYAAGQGLDVSVADGETLLQSAEFGGVSDYAAEAMRWAVASGLISVRDELGIFSQDAVRNKFAAVMFHRFESWAQSQRG